MVKGVIYKIVMKHLFQSYLGCYLDAKETIPALAAWLQNILQRSYEIMI